MPTVSMKEIFQISVSLMLKMKLLKS